MESRLRVLITIILSFSLIAGACAASDTDDSNSEQCTSDSVRGGIADNDMTDITITETEFSSATMEYTDNYAGDIPYKTPNMELEDGSYEVRLYIDDDFYLLGNHRLDMTIGVMNHELKYYTDEVLSSYSVGDSLVVDEDLSIQIESLDVESNIFIKKVLYEQEIIRIGDGFIMLHPQTDDYNLNRTWNLHDVRWFDGNTEFQYELSGIADVTITDDCLIRYHEYSEDTSIYLGRELSIEELYSFLLAQDDIYESPLIIYSYITIENGCVTTLDLGPYTYDGRYICLDD